MKIEPAPNQSGCQEPPKPPPLPPPLVGLIGNTNGDTNGQASKTNTIKSTNGTNGTSSSGLQDTATRKQQQPLSAISIQDLNSVQVRFNIKIFHVKFRFQNRILYIHLAPTN